MLRDILKKIVYEEYQLENEIRYKNLISDQMKFLKKVQRLMSFNVLER